MDANYWYWVIGIIIALIIIYYWYQKESFTMKYGVPVGLTESHHAKEVAAIKALNASAEKL